MDRKHHLYQPKERFRASSTRRVDVAFIHVAHMQWKSADNVFPDVSILVEVTGHTVFSMVKGILFHPRNKRSRKKMARIKLAYIGGGSTRAAGTMASFVQQGENFDGSEVVLIDLNEEHLRIVQTITQKLARAKGLDLTVTITTNQRKGLQGCDAVLTSYRPGGFEARYLDESIPLKYGVIGQETQGPGGFFMALRSIHVTRSIVEDMEGVCPNARLFNYTNPINIVSEAVTHHTFIPTVSFCEGPIMTNREYVEVIRLDPDKLDAVSIGLNHGSWSIRHLDDGQDFLPVLRDG